MLRTRLNNFCKKQKLISHFQASGKEGVRTSDHLLVFKHLIHKYLKVKKSKLFVCFYDLKKAFDFVPRTQLFFSLLKNYKIGGKFLKILQNIYRDNTMVVNLDNGITKPFNTTIGTKQGCVFSPLVFNLFIDSLPSVYASECDPVYVGN